MLWGFGLLAQCLCWQLAEKMTQLIQNPERWPAMGAAGRAHIADQYDIRKQGVALGAVYREIAGQ